MKMKLVAIDSRASNNILLVTKPSYLTLPPSAII
jgi:hypothetical protein